MRVATIERRFAGSETIIPVDRWDVAAALGVDSERVRLSAPCREMGLYLVDLVGPAETAHVWVVPR